MGWGIPGSCALQAGETRAESPPAPLEAAVSVLLVGIPASHVAPVLLTMMPAVAVAATLVHLAAQQ